MRLLELLGIVQPKSNVDTIELNGPFIEEEYLVKHKHRCGQGNLLKSIYSKCNLVISRDLLILTADKELLSRDNPRIELGLNHHIHCFELSFRNDKDFEILAVDHFIILNPSDKEIIKDYLNHHLPTDEELKRQHLTYEHTYVRNSNL